MTVSIAPIWPWPAVLIVCGGLLAFAHWTYVKGTPGRRTLLALRWCAIILSALVLLRPSLVFSKQLDQTSSLVILVDKSKSMMLRDMWANQSRFEALRKVLQESEPTIQELAKKVQVRGYEFSGTLDEAVLAKGEPNGEQTALGRVLGDVMQRTAGERVAGIVLLSDGANTTGVSPLTIGRQLAGQRTPVYAFGFGRETAGDQVRDIAARTILAGPTVFAKNKMAVRGEYAANGYTDQQIPVRLLIDGVERARGVTTVSSGAGRGIIELSTVPEKAGDIKVTLEATPQPGELVPGNNSISTYVTVRTGGISVLQIEGKYRFWEPKYLRWALDQSPDIELYQLFLLDTDGQKSALPPNLFTTDKYDVVILGDVSARQFTTEQLRALRVMVEEGSGLLMMGGYDSFGAGGWGDSPIADLLPVKLDAADRQMKEPLRMLPTEAGMRHFILRLAGNSLDANRKTWEELRPLDGGSGWAGLKPGALLLASTPANLPLMAAQDVGAGRSIAFSGDTTWRWRRGKAGIEAHARFWRQLVLWLAHKDEAAGNQVRVRLSKRRLAVSQNLAVEATVENPDGSAVPNAKVQCLVELPNKEQAPLEIYRQGDVYRGTFWQTDLAGDYTVRVVATADGKDLGDTRVKFLVHEEDNELQQLAADLETMRSLAQMTGGEYHTPEELPKFLETMKGRDLSLQVTQPVYETLWDRWQVLALFAAIVCTEWLIRKRRGLA